MPTKKKTLTFHTDDDCMQKLRYIAQRKTRSISNLLEHICKLHIEEYEHDNGGIEIPPDTKNEMR